MVSYSRLRPAMSRAEPRRCCLETAAVDVDAGACGAAPGRGGSVPVVLMLSPIGRQARVATDKEVLREGGVSSTESAPCLAYFVLPLNRFMAAVRPSFTMASTASAARPTTSGSTAASARE